LPKIVSGIALRVLLFSIVYVSPLLDCCQILHGPARFAGSR
jgi:hypothetical protein